MCLQKIIQPLNIQFDDFSQRKNPNEDLQFCQNSRSFLWHFPVTSHYILPKRNTTPIATIIDYFCSLSKTNKQKLHLTEIIHYIFFFYLAFLAQQFVFQALPLFSMLHSMYSTIRLSHNFFFIFCQWFLAYFQFKTI